MEHSSPNETGAPVPGDTTQSQPPPSESQQGTNHLGGIKVSLVPAHKTAFMRRLSKERRVCRFILSDPWFQIYIISVICQNLPGMYNALSGLGGFGQVNPTVTANATVALLAVMTGTALFVAGPVFDRLGPRLCLLLGGWTYPLHVGSLLYFKSTGNAAFVVGSGALLGIGASFVWVAQGAIVTTYVPESQRGRAIAIFWIIFNLGGCIGSLASLASNYNSTSGSVSNFTNILLLSIMCAGWLMGISICPPSQVAHLQPTVQRNNDWRQMARLTMHIMSDWKVLCMLPLFFTANVFYPYQQNVVNGQTFTIRTRSLNGALYWSAQIFGGLFIGLILDLSGLNRQVRARIGWILLFVSGFIIWGGGYAFQKWSSENSAQLELKQYIDFSHGRRYVGPMFLYVFYGMYDAFWQSFCYWLIGTRSNSPKITAILVGAYKMFQSIGGAMSWRLNAMCKPAMTQFAMNWGLCIGALVIAIPSVLAVTLTSKEDVYEAENVDEHEVGGKSSETDES